MTFTIRFSVAAFALLIAVPAPAQTALEALDEVPETLAHLPGDPGTGESGIRIRRGTGFTTQEAPEITSARGAFYASTGRAVQVDDLLETPPPSATPRIIILRSPSRNRNRTRY